MTRILFVSRRARSAVSSLAALVTLLAGCASDQAGEAGAETTPSESCWEGINCDSDPGGVVSQTRATFAYQEQAIYAEILARTFGAPYYVLFDQSFPVGRSSPEQVAQDFHYLAQELSGLSGDAFAYFLSANLKSQEIPPDLDLGAPYTLIDRATLLPLVDTDRDTGRWSGFFKKFPDTPGLLWIAHVGFDTTETQALAFLRWQAGGLAMWCRYFLLKRSGDTWRIVDDVITVIA